MSDISQGPGFELPSYDDLVNQMGNSDNDKLQKVAQILATAQVTHGVLSNFSSYKSAVDDFSKSVFDPVKNEFVKGVNKVGDVVGKIPGASGDVSTDLLQIAKNPNQLKAMAKTQIAKGKKIVSDEFANAKKTASKTVKSIEDGEMPDLDFSGKDQLMSAARSIAKKTDISDRIVNDFQDVVNQRYEAIPADMKRSLLDMGIGEDELKQVVSGAAPRDLQKLAWEKMGRAARYDNPFESPELDIPEEYLNKVYKARKFLDKLKVPQEEGGMGMGDATLARVGKTAKATYNAAKSEAQATMDEFEAAPAKIGKRLRVKQQAQARKKFQAEQEEMNKEPEFPEFKPSTQKPSLTSEFEELPEIDLTNNIAKDATSDLTNGDIVSSDDAVNSTMSGLQKAKKALMTATEDSTDYDELPFGELINGALGLATMGTMIADLFTPKPKQTLTVQGEQLGV